MSDEKLFNIQMAAEASGVSAHTIRAWEKRYQALTPMRSDAGKRQYNSGEVDRLKLLAALVNLGSSISQIARLPDEELKETYERLCSSKERFTSFMPSFEPAIEGNVLEKLRLALTTFQVKNVTELLNHARTTYNPRNFAIEVMKPLLSELENFRRTGKMPIAQVQALQALIKFHAGILIYSNVGKDFKTSRKFVLTSYEQTNHEMGLIMTALLCCHHRKNFYYLNNNLPAESIVQAVNATDAQVLVLNLSSQHESHSVHGILENLSPAVEVWLVTNGRTAVSSKLKSVRVLMNLEELDHQLQESL